ncbi:Orn/Lys/Arg family decarboxylase [Limnobaculum parvum]|uniref:Arginine decarboxylase n=1 Tax=Limnobaculum parvum TaxID=2172103 RepID=A0A2Y9TXE3_9GAMM|nr:Orn/Lys/Arg decarboxylase N-terminal domain-containing protein [Limnobaculum parvum]AWH88355.1 arginine decarboxylase [Limnobaculum parvum]
MEISSERLVGLNVLMIHADTPQPTAINRAVQTLVLDLNKRGINVTCSGDFDDACSIVLADSTIQCVVMNWMLQNDDENNQKARDMIKSIRSRNTDIPIFLMIERNNSTHLTADVMRQTDELIWLLEDTAFFISGRIYSAILRYRESIAPPLTKAIMGFAEKYEYSWHTPGHTGGTAFLKSPVGRVFHDYFGENLLRSDLSISVGELGSLLDHSGPIGESEKFCAKVFGADRAYTVTNGSSMSNRVILMSSVARNDYALCDRNAHKSTEQALTMTGVIPTYLIPSRNNLGMIGPIYAQHLHESAVKESIKNNPLANDKNKKATHVIITNSTYDGLIYHVPTVIDLLDASVDRIHFDEAWYGYARFNPIYHDHFGMFGDPKDYPKDKPTIFTTTSTHKLLAALSQASLIGVRDGRNPVPHERFNESYMMHASTSPLYPIIMSNEVSAKMMSGVSGLALTTESITEAVSFRKAVRKIKRQAHKEQDWFFSTWNADYVTDPSTGERIAFEDAPDELLVTNTSCWKLNPQDSWHGFKGIEDNYCMLDPIKVSVVMPGVANDGSMEEFGIPATLVTAFLSQRGIQVEKTTDFTILFLFSLGVTRGKYGTLVNALLRFKEAYDNNILVSEVLYAHNSDTPACYANMGLKTLSDAMFSMMKDSQTLAIQAQAFSTLPQPVMTPADAYVKLVHNEIDSVRIDDLHGRVLATGVVPYPPGIPMIMPGESAGGKDSPYIRYLQILQEWDRRFPDFTHDIHGVENIDGDYFVQCLKA